VVSVDIMADDEGQREWQGNKYRKW
jgi:hypothetical protein